MKDWISGLATLCLILGGVTSRADAAAITTFNANATEWSSSTASGPGIFPIGGSGQVNGGFVKTTSAADNAEIDLRAQLRFFGPVLPQTNDGVLTATYVAPVGISSAPNRAKWNFDYNIDLRQSTHTTSDYTTTLTITDRTVSVSLYAFIPPAAHLAQDSENPGFAFLAANFPAFDPNATGDYLFDLKLVPLTFTGDTLEAKMDVRVVPEPSTLMLLGVGIAGIAGYSWRRRKVAAA